MTQTVDFLDGVRPKTEFFDLVAAKKPLLNRLISEVEKETGVECPPTSLFYPMLSEGDGVIRGTI